MYACFPQHIFDVRDASLQVVGFESRGNKCTGDPILWQLWCSPQVIRLAWLRWVPNADWNSISASSVSKIPHLPLREAAWKMWGIFSYITFNTPLLWNLHPGIMFEASWSKGVPRYEIQVYCILIVKTSVLELCKYQLV